MSNSCDPVDCSLPSSFVHGILQARILEWVAISFSRGSSRPRDRTQVSCIVGRFFTTWSCRRFHKNKLVIFMRRFIWWESWGMVQGVFLQREQPKPGLSSREWSIHNSSQYFQFRTTQFGAVFISFSQTVPLRITCFISLMSKHWAVKEWSK